MSYDDTSRLRSRQGEADDDATRWEGEDDPGSPTIVGKTVAIGTYPTAAAAFYGITPQLVTGAETEGAAGTLTGQPGTFRALNLGGTVPPAGTTVVCRYVAHRWIFRHG